jgi:hypothetical protein
MGVGDVVHQMPLPLEQRADHSLRTLYGELVFPKELVSWFSHNVLEMKHYSEHPVDLADARGNTYSLLYKLLLRVENKPVITRFWLFAECTCRLLLACLLKIPASVFNTTTIQMRKQNSKRQDAFHKFYTDLGLAHDLRRACLCLRLTVLAVSLTAKQSGNHVVQEDQTPQLVLLGQRVVQLRTKLA